MVPDLNLDLGLTSILDFAYSESEVWARDVAAVIAIGLKAVSRGAAGVMHAVGSALAIRATMSAQVYGMGNHSVVR